MEVVQLPRRGLHAQQVIGHGIDGELPRVRHRRRKVQGVGGMGENALDARLGRQLVVQGHIGRVDGFRLAAAGIAGEKLEGVGPDGGSVPRHLSIALRTRQMATDGQLFLAHVSLFPATAH